MKGTPVYEQLDRNHPALNGYPEVGPDSAGAIGIYTGLGVADSEDPDILVFMTLTADADLAHLHDDDPDGHHVSGLWARLPGDPQVGPVIAQIMTQIASDLEVRAFIAWCQNTFAPKNDETLAAIGYG